MAIAAMVRMRRAVRAAVRACTVQRRAPIGRAPLIHARGQIRPFSLDQPTELRAASRALGSTLDARAMAGGIDLLNEMKLGSEVAHVVYLGRIPELRTIACPGVGTSGANGTGVTLTAPLAFIHASQVWFAY